MSCPAVHLRNVGKCFGGLRAIDDISLSFWANQITAVVGENGSGKTTLLNLVSGFLEPDFGEIEVFGQATKGHRPHLLAARGVGRTFQVPRIVPELSVLESVLVAVTPKSDETILAAITNRHLRNDQKYDLASDAICRVGLSTQTKKPVNELSHGQRRLLQLAQVLARQPKILLLDEPFSGLADSYLNTITDLLRSERIRGIAIVMVEHRIDVALNLADRFVSMKMGHIQYDGLPSGMLSFSENNDG